MPLRRGDCTGKIENAAQEIPLRLAREERRDARNQRPVPGWLVPGSLCAPESSLWVCQPEPCRRKAVCTLGMHAGGLEFGPLSPLIAP